LNFLPKTGYGAISAPVDNLVPGDAKYFGGKAANFRLLRRTIPNNSPPAIAFSFDLWDQFMEQTLPNGKTLRAEIAERLAPYPSYPPAMASLRTTLSGIRNLITGTASFTTAQQSAITGRSAFSILIKRFAFAALRTWKTRSNSRAPACTIATAAAFSMI
jgi:hypothetical protein